MEAGNEIELDRIELIPATRDLIYFACQRKARLFSLIRIIARLIEEKTPLTGFSLRPDTRLFSNACFIVNFQFIADSERPTFAFIFDGEPSWLVHALKISYDLLSSGHGARCLPN